MGSVELKIRLRQTIILTLAFLLAGFAAMYFEQWLGWSAWIPAVAIVLYIAVSGFAGVIRSLMRLPRSWR